MIKWDNLDQLDLGTLRRANAVLAHQQKIAGGMSVSAPYSSASIIGNQGINSGMNIQSQTGLLSAFHSLALNFFVLGMLYVHCQHGDLTDTIREITGGANHGDDEV